MMTGNVAAVDMLQEKSKSATLTITKARKVTLLQLQVLISNLLRLR